MSFNNDFDVFRFIFKNNGVLFENDLLQIGVKSEFRQNLGRLGLFYGNKTQVALEVNSNTINFKFLINLERYNNFVCVHRISNQSYHGQQKMLLS